MKRDLEEQYNRQQAGETMFPALPSPTPPWNLRLMPEGARGMPVNEALFALEDDAGTLRDWFLTPACSRRKDLETGLIVDVSAMAQMVEIPYPVALSREAWQRVQAAPEEMKETFPPDARLWSLLSSARYALLDTCHADVCEVPFAVLLPIAAEQPASDALQRLWAHLGTGDAGEAVVTILRESESSFV